MSQKGTCDIALIGLAVMGENLALNIASRGYKIAVYNRTASVTDAFVASRGKQPNVVGCHSLEELVGALKTPRKIMMMVKAGPAVDDLIAKLTPLLSTGDVLIDGGNTLVTDTERRTREVEAKGSTAGKIPCSTIERASTVTPSRCENAVAGAGSVRSSAGT